MFHSLRWRLPLSYAGIALLTALGIGLILITTLRGYYAQREQDYMVNNATTMAPAVADLMNTHQDATVISSQIKVLSFMSQTRIRVLDAGSQMLADTGTPAQDIQYVVSGANPAGGAFVLSTQVGAVTAGGPPSVTVSGSAAEAVPGQVSVMIPASVPLTGALTNSPQVFQATFVGDNVAPLPKSDQQALIPLPGAQRQIVGYLEVSEGPAFGAAIVSSVIWAWVGASLFGVVLAGVTGWLVSRRITTPLLSLAKVTGRMADGDLATRADITTGDEFETLAHSFNEMAGRVEQTVIALKRFVADAAHELDTPLTALRTNLELIVAAQEPDGRAHIEEGLAQVRRLETLTHGLLDLSRIEARREELTSVDVVALVRRVCEVAASRAEQAGLVFEVQTPPGALLVDGSEALLERAVMNLLDNSLKFTPTGGAVMLSLKEETGDVAIAVEDSGIGIPADELPLLFGRFHRARNATGYPGNGLGLAIVQAIVRSHGGDISVAAKPEGMSFTIRLPSSGPDNRARAA